MGSSQSSRHVGLNHGTLRLCSFRTPVQLHVGSIMCGASHETFKAHFPARETFSTCPSALRLPPAPTCSWLLMSTGLACADGFATSCKCTTEPVRLYMCWFLFRWWLMKIVSRVSTETYLGLFGRRGNRPSCKCKMMPLCHCRVSRLGAGHEVTGAWERHHRRHCMDPERDRPPPFQQTLTEAVSGDILLARLIIHVHPHPG